MASTDPSTGLAVDMDTFYTKSLMTPSNKLMSSEAISALTSWMSSEGWNTTTVGVQLQLSFCTFIDSTVLTALKNWFVQLELYGGSSSLIGMIPSDATAFTNRDTLWTFQASSSLTSPKFVAHRSQLYASSPTFRPPYPDEGFTFVDGLANSITDNEPDSYHYGYVACLRSYRRTSTLPQGISRLY